MEFWKYQGAGNDFVMIDDRGERFDHNNFDLVEKICNRRFGIGGDGLILLRNTKEGDLEMVYFNSDGRQSSMCGNGGRCFAAFAKDLGVVDGAPFRFLAIDGWHEAEFHGDLVNLKMIDVDGIENIGSDYFLDTGSPHYVVEVEDVSGVDIVPQAREIRYNERFSKEGTNVNFVCFTPEFLEVRTYERGVEGETLACGTGVTAVALVAEALGKNTGDGFSSLKVPGGKLEVSYEKSGSHFSNIWLKGPAEKVFHGQIDLNLFEA